MKRIVLPVLVVLFSVGLFAGEKSGVGFEFGTNYMMASNEYSGTGTNFVLEFRLSGDIAFGYFRSEGNLSRTSGVAIGSPEPAQVVNMKITMNAVQIKKAILSNLVYIALRVGTCEVSTSGIDYNAFSQSNPSAGVFVKAIPLRKATGTFDAAIAINLGYNFVPIKAISDGTTEGGVMNRLNPLLKDVNSFDIGVSASVTF